MKQAKRFSALALVGLGLFAALASNARADDDDWGRVALGVFLGAPVYSPPVYVAPPPPPPVEYRYYGPPAPPPGYYYRRDHDWHGRGYWRHREGDDD